MFKKILAATLALTLSPAVIADNILVVMSDEDHLPLKGEDVYATGFYLNELMGPVKRFIDKGHTLTFATPKGMAPSLDIVSDNVMFFSNEESLKTHKQLLADLMITDKIASPVVSLNRVKQIGYEHFDALYVPGGHAPMNDLLKSAELGTLLKHFHEKEKLTALVCHGPIALLSTLSEADQFVTSLEKGEQISTDSTWTYAGYNMTAFSNAEEEASKGWLGGGTMKFYPQDGLVAAGGNYRESANLWEPNVVVDRELITGQNPASAWVIAEEIIKHLSK
ncbi:MAG: type 1 glutamine amidotransferase domain-containing protein [Gammaproteobacteria bacterium]|nr:type 1 glutamine amidotransferase domain-containing protein [Gammaproteobacteria bacterium]